jgi:hypothetical protein
MEKILPKEKCLQHTGLTAKNGSISVMLIVDALIKC